MKKSSRGGKEMVLLESPVEGGGSVGVEKEGVSEVIEWALKEWPKLRTEMEGVETSITRVKNLVVRFNRAADRVRRTTTLFTRPSTPLLQWIMQRVYLEAVSEPHRLNRYPPFSPSVYGETSFDFICKMIQQMTITKEDIFIDLGSGVGQVVLQMAASTECKLCLGIEKAEIPLMYSEKMAEAFRKWMAWFGKRYRPYKLLKGDFLLERFRDKILSGTVIFVNNWAFGPTVDHKLKEIFAELKDGARIVSSKAFCPLNFRISARKLSDIGSILFVSELGPCRRAVSWTESSFSYYLHVVDRTRLEHYFQNTKKQLVTEKARKKKLIEDGESSKKFKSEVENPLERGEESPLGGVTTRRAWSEYCRKRETESHAPEEPKQEVEAIPTEVALNSLLATYREQMIQAVDLMNSGAFREKLEQEIAIERERKLALQIKAKRLENKVDFLLKEGVELLEERLAGLGVSSPKELILTAKNLVETNRELETKVAQLDSHVSSLTASIVSNISDQLDSAFATRAKLRSQAALLTDQITALESSQTPFAPKTSLPP